MFMNPVYECYILINHILRPPQVATPRFFSRWVSKKMNIFLFLFKENKKINLMVYVVS